MYYVYVLRSQTTGRRYVGQTDDVDRRLREHNTPTHNAKKFTSRQAGPWKLIHQESYPTRTEAMRREKWLKSGVGRAWLDAQFGKSSPPEAD